jgi:uncharacterized protein YjbI with pentapeptide repeats
MKKIILITMLMSAVFAQSDCNKDNWQEYYNSEGRDMTECDLSEADLRGADLSDARLSGVDLRGANLLGLTGADLTGADLTGADLSGANLYGANLEEADLTGADLRGADFTHAGPRGTDFTGADLTGANLTRANLIGANLTRANLTGANLTGSNLSMADLSRANLEGVISSMIRGVPDNLPEGWSLVDGKFELIKEPIVYNEYTFEITDLSNSGKIPSAYYTLWIDWNKDGNFSPEWGGWDKSVALQERKDDFEGEKWKIVETMEIVESPKFSIVVYKNGEVFQNIKTPFDMQVDIPFDRRFFTVEDVNFDGYEDFYFTDYMGMVNISFIIYLYNSTSEKFEINEDYRSITSPRFDIDHQIIKSFTRGNAAYHESEIYIVLNDKLTRISKIIDDVGSNEYKYIIYDGEKEVAVNESLRKVKLNIAFFKTQKFNVIIDLIDNSNYRYASWSASKNLRNTPDLILNNGVKQETENEISYKFKKGEFSYVCIFNKLTSDGQLKVFQNKKELVKQEASVFIVPNEVKPYEGNKHKITLDIKNNLKD